MWFLVFEELFLIMGKKNLVIDLCVGLGESLFHWLILPVLQTPLLTLGFYSLKITGLTSLLSLLKTIFLLIIGMAGQIFLLSEALYISSTGVRTLSFPSQIQNTAYI